MDDRDASSVSIAVTGHRGTGRDTVAAAVTDRFGIAAHGPGAPPEQRAAADLLVHVLGAVVRDCDRDFLSRQRRPVIVVAGKADVRGPRAAVAAATAASRLRRPVYPVSGLLATATVDEALLADLRGWVRARIDVPPLAAAFVDVPDPDERRRRGAALDALGATGLRAALALCAEGPATGDEAAVCRAMTARLRAAGGFGALAEPLRGCGPELFARRRLARRRAAMLAQARWGR